MYLNPIVTDTTNAMATGEGCDPLPMTKVEDGNAYETCWQLTTEQIEEIRRTGRIYVMIHADHVHPMSVSADTMFMLPDEWEFEILQLDPKEELTMKRFASLDGLKKNGLKPERKDYIRVYKEKFAKVEGDFRIHSFAEKLYERFNTQTLPDDYRGHSLSVSDVIMIRTNNRVFYLYCDSLGFAELSEWGKTQ
ncbi:MAG: YodL domain-containing protein [Eubacteriales bacterium]|nr:YodL domain-containing protein [Eubacteriales bacterium]